MPFHVHGCIFVCIVSTSVYQMEEIKCSGKTNEEPEYYSGHLLLKLVAVRGVW